MKENTFVSGSDYSFESSDPSPFDSNSIIQDHYLTMHKASQGNYTCVLISSNMKVIDTKTQHVVTESKLFDD